MTGPLLLTQLPSDAFLAAIVRSTSDAIIATDLDGHISYFNEGAEHIYGFSAAEITGRPIGVLFPPDRRHEIEEIQARVRRGERLPPYQTVRQRKDGSRVDISLSVSPIVDTTGVVVGSSRLGRDITAHKCEEALLRESRVTTSRLAAIVDGSDDAIVSKDLQGIVTSWNRGAARIFGYTAEEMIGKPILLLLPPERHEEEQHILARLQRGERIDHFETVRVHKDGRRIDVSLTISPVRDGEGRIVGASKIARDITEIKSTRLRLQAHAAELEQQVRERTAKLEESLAEVEAFSYSLSHDMRAPLRAIQSLTEIVIADFGGRIPDGVPLLHKVVKSANRLDRLIRDVLGFARLSRTEIPLGPVSVEEVAREILRERPDLQPPHAKVSIASPLADVTGHEALLTPCLSNLLDNAVKFVAPGVRPVVQVFTERRGDRVRVNVRDNGIGIDQGGQRTLFDLFHRLPSAQAYQGSGVGLAIVRKSVARMNGVVGVVSAPGLGSTFWVELDAPPA